MAALQSHLRKWIRNRPATEPMWLEGALYVRKYILQNQFTGDVCAGLAALFDDFETEHARENQEWDDDMMWLLVQDLREVIPCKRARRR